MKSIIFTISDIAKLVRERIALRKDCIIFWTGVRGSGKSTGCLRLCKKIGTFEVKHLDELHKVKKFSMKRDMIYTREDAINFMTNRHYSIQMIDELINIAYNREFAQTDQQSFIKALNQYRSHFNIISACMPFFYDLDPDLRNLCWMRIEVIRRGLAVIHTPNDSSYGNDPWDTDYNRKIERKWRKPDGSIKAKYHQLTTFRGYLIYNALKPEQEKRYEEVRNEKRALANKYLSNQIPEKQMSVYDNLVKMALDGKLTQDLLENVCNINNLNYLQARSHINRKLKEITKSKDKTLKKLIVKEVKKEDNLDELGYVIT